VNEHDHLLTILEDGPVFVGTVEGPDAFEPLSASEEGEGGLIGEPADFDEVF
jgi:hypothetical protein